MPNGTFDDERDDGCEMTFADAVPGMPDHRCSRSPTVGGNGLYRYCAHHMQMVADAGATTLQYDTRAIDDPSPIDSDAPASVHGAVAVSKLEQIAALAAGCARGMFQRPGESDADFRARMLREVDPINRASVGS